MAEEPIEFAKGDRVIFWRVGHPKNGCLADVTKIYPGEGDDPTRYGLLFDGDRLTGLELEDPVCDDSFALASELVRYIPHEPLFEPPHTNSADQSDQNL